MRRLTLLLLVTLLSAGLGGAFNLVLVEPCRVDEAPAAHDSACPPTCLSCGCCGHPVVATVVLPFTSPLPPTVASAPPPLLAGAAAPREILHVPRPLAA